MLDNELMTRDRWNDGIQHGRRREWRETGRPGGRGAGPTLECPSTKLQVPRNLAHDNPLRKRSARESRQTSSLPRYFEIFPNDYMRLRINEWGSGSTKLSAHFPVHFMRLPVWIQYAILREESAERNCATKLIHVHRQADHT